MISIDSYKFPKYNSLFWFLDNLRRYKFKFYKAFYFHNRRPYSRLIVRKFLPKNGVGLELGCGERSISPIDKTIMSDAYESHGGKKSLAKVFFPSEKIPFVDESFSFVVTEHMLEHCLDPIISLKEIHRVLSYGGILYLFLPHKERTFDKLRPRTPADQLIAIHEGRASAVDFIEDAYQSWQKNVLSVGGAKHYLAFTKKEAIEQGEMHISVWVPEDVIPLLKYLGMEIMKVVDFVEDRPDSFLIIAKK